MSVDVLQGVRALVADILGTSDVDIDTEANLFDLGIDSISIVVLAGIIQKTYGLKLGAREIFDNPSVSKIALAVRTQSKGR